MSPKILGALGLVLLVLAVVACGDTHSPPSPSATVPAPSPDSDSPTPLLTATVKPLTPTSLVPTPTFAVSSVDSVESPRPTPSPYPSSALTVPPWATSTPLPPTVTPSPKPSPTPLPSSPLTQTPWYTSTPLPPTVTPSPKPSPTPVPTVQPFVYWSNWETGEWTPSSIPPKCGPLEEMFDVLPIDVTIVDVFTPPGRPGGDSYHGSYYVGHGHLRSNNTPHEQIEVKFPAEGFSLYQANRQLEDYYIEEKETDTVKHIVDDEEQVTLIFHHPCGIAVKIAHLAQVTDRWAEIIKDIPVFTNDSKITFMPSGKDFVESGEVLARAIGHATNTSLDFGVYDLRSKNDSAERLSIDWPKYVLDASHGICWTGLFGPEVQKLLEGKADSNATSDFCE